MKVELLREMRCLLHAVAVSLGALSQQLCSEDTLCLHHAHGCACVEGSLRPGTPLPLSQVIDGCLPKLRPAQSQLWTVDPWPKEGYLGGSAFFSGTLKTIPWENHVSLSGFFMTWKQGCYL